MASPSSHRRQHRSPEERDENSTNIWEIEIQLKIENRFWEFPSNHLGNSAKKMFEEVQSTPIESWLVVT